MRNRATAILLAIALVFGVLVSSAPADATPLREGTDKAAAFFDPLKVSKIGITRILGGPALTHDYLDSTTWREANIKISLAGTSKYTIIKRVGVRMKGSFTRRFEKLSVKVRFDAFVKGQRYRGLRRLTLNAMMQDPSMLHEVTAYRLYRAMGVPAPRAGFSRLTLDGSYLGLYLNLESVDDIMVQRWFSSTKHVYSGPFNCDLTPNNMCQQPTVGDTNRADLTAATKLHDLHGKDWWIRFPQLANVDPVLAHMATDIVLRNWDGYSDRMQNNYFIHFDKNNRFTLMPWGTDQTFTAKAEEQLAWDGSRNIFAHTDKQMSTLLSHCLEYRPCRERFMHEGYRVSQTVNEIGLVNFKDQLANMILTRKLYKNDLSRTNYSTLKLNQDWITSFLKLRQQALKNFMAQKSPIALRVRMPKIVRVGNRIKPYIEPVWEPGVTATYQWFADDKPIEGATSKSLKLKKANLNNLIKLQITLKKPGTPDRVFYSKTKRVKRSQAILGNN